MHIARLTFLITACCGGAILSEAQTAPFIQLKTLVSDSGTLSNGPVGGNISYDTATGLMTTIDTAATTTYAGPTATGLYSGNISMSSTNNTPTPAIQCTAAAGANLATGSLTVSGTSQVVEGSVISESVVSAELYDTVTLHIPGASPNTKTYIGFQFVVSGTVYPPAPVPQNTLPAAILQASMALGLGTSGTVVWNYTTTPGAPPNGQFTEFSTFDTDTIVSQTPQSVVLNGVFDVSGAAPSGTVHLIFSCTVQAGGTCDHTTSINFLLPQGVTMTSQSGVFLTQAPPPVPILLPGGIVNAASYAQSNGIGSPVAPGSLIALFTSPLQTGAANFSTASLPDQLSGVSLTINGIPAPIVSVAPNSEYPYVSAQVPFGALPAGQASGSVRVVLTVNSVQSAGIQLSIVPAAPGIFTIPPTGSGNAILTFLNPETNAPAIAAPASASLGYPTAPIPRGASGFFYVTGLGAMTPSVQDGSGICPAADGVCNANALPHVTIGGIAAEVSFAGQAPGFPGVYQVNITIPQSAPTGDTVAMVVESADGFVTSNTATIAVQ
jgi:uncharacterized protein (TIGR03437 family)